MRMWLLTTILGLMCFCGGCITPFGYAEDLKYEGTAPQGVTCVRHEGTFGLFAITTNDKVYILAPLYKSKYAEYVTHGPK